MTANLGIHIARGSPEAQSSWKDPPSKTAVTPTQDAPKPVMVKSGGAAEPHPKVSRDEREKNIKEALLRLNAELRKNDRSLQFSMDKELNRTVIKVRNPHTGEVIRQIPDEAVLRVAHNIEAIKGLLVNELT